MSDDEPFQLYMLAPAEDLIHGGLAKYHPGDWFWDKHDNKMDLEGCWEMKLQEAEERDLVSSIMENGIQNPVVLRPSDTQIQNGHHRIVSSHTIDPRYEVPIRWNEHGYGGTGAEGPGWDGKP